MPFLTQIRDGFQYLRGLSSYNQLTQWRVLKRRKRHGGIFPYTVAGTQVSSSVRCVGSLSEIKSLSTVSKYLADLRVKDHPRYCAKNQVPQSVFPSMMTSAANPRGSNILLMHDSTPLLVNGLSCIITSKKKASVSKFQLRPKLR